MNRIRQKHGFTLIELVVVIAVTLLLVMPMSALVGQSRERTLQKRCVTNLRMIYGAIQNYADDNDGYICPFYDGGAHGFTWEEILRPYIYGDNASYYYRQYKDPDSLLFYCPKRYATGQSSQIAGYQTNYCVNGSVMGTPPRPPVPWIPPGAQDPYPMRKFEDFQDHNNIAMLLEIEFWVIFGANSSSIYSEGLDYVHYDKTHILTLNGTVKRFKKQSPLPVKLKDEM